MSKWVVMHLNNGAYGDSLNQTLILIGNAGKIRINYQIMKSGKSKIEELIAYN